MENLSHNGSGNFSYDGDIRPDGGSKYDTARDIKSDLAVGETALGGTVKVGAVTPFDDEERFPSTSTRYDWE